MPIPRGQSANRNSNEKLSVFANNFNLPLKMTSYSDLQKRCIKLKLEGKHSFSCNVRGDKLKKMLDKLENSIQTISGLEMEKEHLLADTLNKINALNDLIQMHETARAAEKLECDKKIAELKAGGVKLPLNQNRS